MENVIMKGLVNWWAMNVNRSLRAVSQWICRPPRNPSKNSSSFQHHVQRYPCDGLYLFLCKRTGKWKSRLSTSRGKQVDCNMDWNMEHGAWSMELEQRAWKHRVCLGLRTWVGQQNGQVHSRNNQQPLPASPSCSSAHLYRSAHSPFFLLLLLMLLLLSF